MRRLLIGVAAAGFLVAPAMAHSSCQQLAIERHAILKDAGYCFSSPWAIAYFGNAGCRYEGEYVPLTLRARKMLDSIMAEEAAQGCRSW